MMSAFFHIQPTLNKSLGGGQINPPPPEKTTLKKPSLIRAKTKRLKSYNTEVSIMIKRPKSYNTEVLH